MPWIKTVTSGDSGNVSTLYWPYGDYTIPPDWWWETRPTRLVNIPPDPRIPISITISVPGREGWICPTCKRSLNPDVSECPHCGVEEKK